MSPLIAGLGYLVVYAAGTWALREHALSQSILGNLGLLLPPITVCAIILRRRKEWRGAQRLFWDTVGAGSALWALGHIGWAFEVIVESRVSWIEWHTVFSLCGGIAPLIALFARPYRGVQTDAVGAIGLILASYGLLAVFMFFHFVLVPSLVSSDADSYSALLVLVQVNRALLFAAMLASVWAARRTAWRATFAYLALGTGIGFFLRLVTSLAINRGEYHVGTLYDLAWIGPFICTAFAALAAPGSPRRDGPIELSVNPIPAVFAVVPAFLVPIVGYGGVLVQPLGGTGDAFRALVTGLMTVTGLALLTLRLAAQGGELQRADGKLRLLAAASEQTADLILFTKADGSFEHANDAFVRALGYPRSELARLRFPDLIEQGFATVGAHIEREVRERDIWRGTLVRRRRDGSTFPASCTVVGLRDAAGRIVHFVGVERDITEELKMRDQLVHTERLSAVGELVAGVAHEINNPLQTIVASIELVLEEHKDAPGRRDLEVIRREAARAGQIVRNLLSFVRRSAPDRVAADLNELLRRTLDLREFHLQQHNIEVVLDLHQGPLPVLANREEIQQIVLNLLINAEQAILSASDHGRITLRTRTAARSHVLEIADTGPGIGPEVRGRLFEPFFTTKDVGKGTGLGLSISHGIAAAHGGSLDLAPAEAGACFRLMLPAGAASASGQGDQHQVLGDPVAPQSPVPGSGTSTRRVALIVDDEAPIRRLLGRLLERRGFEVIEAETGEAALEAAGRQPLALVLCDVRMPGMSGVDLYHALAREGDSGARQFVFITGDRGSVTDAEHGLRDVPVLAKPFTSADLDALIASNFRSSSAP